MTITYSYLERMAVEFSSEKEDWLHTRILLMDYLRYLKKRGIYKRERAVFPDFSVPKQTLPEFMKQAQRSEQRNMK